MSTYFHGTTQRGLNAILTGTGKLPGPWSCADQDRMTYLWDASALIEGEGYEVDQVIAQAFESAQVQAAVNAEDTTLYVLELELDADSVEPDYSCENMTYAVTIAESQLTRSAIVKAYRCEFSKWNAPFIIAGLLENDHFATNYIEDERLVTLAEAVSAHGVFMEELHDFQWEQCEIA